MSNHKLTAILYRAAHDFAREAEDFTEIRGGALRIRKDAVEPLTSHLHLFIAHLLVQLTDTHDNEQGREAILENEEIRSAISGEILDWT